MGETLDLLGRIRKRPGMFIGKRSARGLFLFLQGWLYGKGSVDDFDVLRQFEEWIAAKYKISSSHSWADIITFYSEGDVEALESFFDLLDEFLDSQGSDLLPKT